MKKNLFLLCQLFCISLSAQNRIDFKDLYAPYDGETKIVADSLLHYAHLEDAIIVYKKSNEIKNNKNNLYRIALAFCVLGKSDSAKFYLQEAINQGYFYEYGSFKTDRYMKCLTTDKDYESLAASIDSNEIKKFRNIDTVLQAKLLSARANDQRYKFKIRDSLRKASDTIALNAINTFDDSIRKVNMYILDSIIQVLGRWPGYDIVGEQGESAAWLIVQHADNFVDFQERCLVVLNEALKNDNTNPHNVAYLYDRIMINKGLNQQFGTQNSSNDTVTFKNLEDPEHVDMRRRSFDLPTLESYRQTLMRNYGIKN